MKNSIKIMRFINSTFILSVLIFVFSTKEIGHAQTSTVSTIADSDLQLRISKIEAKLEKRREKLGIPGVALAIVKNGEIVYSKGLGYKNFEEKVPITADTQLAIGSATKAFTGLSVLISQDEGKLSLDDSPKRYLPYFKINDPNIDKNIQIRDLISHSSGLYRTDLAMLTGKLSRVELIKVAGEAKPKAGLRKQFHYQNIMFTVAGEIVSKVQKQTWENFVAAKILSPLGMTNSTMSIKQMKKAEDYSFGYNYNFNTKKAERLPFREILQTAPAGSINSSANDMAKWLRFVLNGGELDGKRIVSEKSFEEWLKPQMKVTPDGKNSYSFGWFLQVWKGKKIVKHAGGIDGFNSMVAMLPEEKLGFVMLTNVSGSSLGSELIDIIFSDILDDEKKMLFKDVGKKEVGGKYRFAQAGFDIEVKVEDGKLVAIVPNQPTYILERVKGRKYRLANAPSGFFITFKDTEAFLEQPHGNYTLSKITAETKAEQKNADLAKELIGSYQSEEGLDTIEIKEVSGKPSLVAGIQPPYPLIKRKEDEFGSPKLPETYYLKVKRDKKGEIIGITMIQPEGKLYFKYLGKKKKLEISFDDLLAKVVKALGGEENLRKINSRVMKYELDFIHQGVKGYGTDYQKAPNQFSSKIVLTALAKKIGSVAEYFDGKNGNHESSFLPDSKYTGTSLEDLKFRVRFHDFLGLNEKIEKAEILRKDKFAGEDVYVLSIEPKKANKVVYFISAKTFLPLRKDYLIASSSSNVKIPGSEIYENYKEIDGVLLPFKVTNKTITWGDILTHVKEIKHNVIISDSVFRKQTN